MRVSGTHCHPYSLDGKACPNTANSARAGKRRHLFWTCESVAPSVRYLLRSVEQSRKKKVARSPSTSTVENFVILFFGHRFRYRNTRQISRRNMAQNAGNKQELFGKSQNYASQHVPLGPVARSKQRRNVRVRSRALCLPSCRHRRGGPIWAARFLLSSGTDRTGVMTLFRLAITETTPWPSFLL